MHVNFDRLPPALAKALEGHGYERLTSVQDAVCKDEARGRDLLVSAQTGSGKTVAFGIAMADELLAGGELQRSHTPQALVIAPTRELAQQVSRELAWLYAETGARTVTCVGGMDPVKERKQLERGADIVVGTPGRLRDHLERGKLDLSELSVVVLDEADEMLDMGFREDLEELLDATGQNRRTLLFSATMPRAIESLAKRYQDDALRITTMGEKRGHGDISYQVVTVTQSDVENAVVNLLRYHDAETAILFCATRDNVKHLHATLSERGFSAVALSGEHSQNERNNALQALRDRRARVCVATDVAARGIDLPSLTLVIHVEIPRDAETLQHRSGRTGRAGKKGTAVLLVPYPRRGRVEGMLRQAQIPAEWIDAPTPEVIREMDRERITEQLLAPVEVDEEDRVIARKLLETMSAEDLAAAFVRSQRLAKPQPEELLDPTSRPPQRGKRAGFEDNVWFRLDVGRHDHAEPRWILPVLCRRGGVSSDAIGQIRITDRETYFEIPRTMAERFEKSAQRTLKSDSDEFEARARIEVANEVPDEVRNRRPRGEHRGEGGGGYEPRSNKGYEGRHRKPFGRPHGGGRPEGGRPKSGGYPKKGKGYSARPSPKPHNG